MAKAKSTKKGKLGGKKLKKKATFNYSRNISNIGG